MGRQGQASIGRAVALLLSGVLVLAGVLLPAPGTPPASADSGDIGHEGPSFAGVSNPPTSSKPQSKLWHNDGYWWANMYDAGSRSWHIFRLDRSTNSWRDTGVQVDGRRQTLADTLWDGDKLYVASHWVTVSSEGTVRTSVSGRPARLYRYSYDPDSNTYSRDTGFPTTITDFSSEALTIDKDSTGRLWATWTQVSGSQAAGYTSKVLVSYTSGSGLTWTTPRTLGSAGEIKPDDISAVVAFDGDRVGIMWSNQLDDTVYWAWRKDSEAATSWHVGPALRGEKEADDHLNLKSLMSDDHGRVYAVVKTSLDQLAGAPGSSAQIRLLVFRPGTGSWSSTTFGTLSDCHTRPTLVIDEQSRRIHVFATAPTAPGCPYSGAEGTIYTKSAPMDDPVFPAGRGTPVLRDASSAHMNDVTSTKQAVNARTGLVVLASNDSTDRYWHADTMPSEPTDPVPESGFTATPQSGSAPLDVQLTDTSTNDPTGWSWDFGDGRTSTAQHPSVTYREAGTYTVTLVARNAAGTGTTAERTITVSPGTGTGTGITRMSTAWEESTSASPSLTIPTPSGTQAGDLLVTCLAMNGSGLAAAPDGWTRMAAPVGVSNPRVYGYYKVAGPAEPSSTQWSFHASVTSGGGTARYSGAQGVDGSASTATGASARTATVPGVTASTAGDMLVGCVAINSGSTAISISGPADLDEAWDIGGKRHEYGDGLLSEAGATGPRTWTFSSSREWSGWLAALRPS